MNNKTTILISLYIFTKLHEHMNILYEIVCLLGSDVAFIHLKSYRDGAYLNQLYFDQCAARQECHATDATPHPVTVYRQIINLSLCYLLMWNITLEHTATHFNILGQTRSGNPFPTFHTYQQTLNVMMVVSQVESVPYPTGLERGTCGVRVHYAICSPTAASPKM